MNTTKIMTTIQPKMQCFARWQTDAETGLSFRDQTILQFGDSWDLLASFILFNPGSALPMNADCQNAHLAAMALPYFFLQPGDTYLRFSIDPLMRSLIRLYADRHSGGVLKLYNLINIRNPNPHSALAQLKTLPQHPRLLTATESIKFGDSPVIIACGANVVADDLLTQELRKFIALVPPKQLYALSQISKDLYRPIVAEPNAEGLVQSYHPSYTFKYGNQTQLH